MTLPSGKDIFNGATTALSHPATSIALQYGDDALRLIGVAKTIPGINIAANAAGAYVYAGKQKAGSGSMEDGALIKCPVGIFSDGPACREGVYASPYLVLKSGGYTKHYYIEGQRIVSKLGAGMDEQPSSNAGNSSVGYAKKHQDLIDGIVRNLKFLGESLSRSIAGMAASLPQARAAKCPQARPVPTKEGSGGGTGGDGGEKFQYFYHPDHLGSTSYITDASGEVYQHLVPKAFGMRSEVHL